MAYLMTPSRNCVLLLTGWLVFAVLASVWPETLTAHWKAGGWIILFLVLLDAILLPIGEGNRILAQVSSGKIDELIAHTYKGDHEKMKQGTMNISARLKKYIRLM